MHLRLLFAALLVLLAVWPAAAQEIPLSVPFVAPGTVAYDPSIPTPEEVIGHRIGERHTRPEQVVRYVEAVAAASERVTLGWHGETWEGRRLVHAMVTAPGRDLDATRRANRRLSDDAASVSDAELATLPVVAYMGYSVHGNEASGTEAALLLLYHLAAGQGPAVDEVLQHAVVLIDPMLNPDGRARFVNWVNANRAGSATFFSPDRQGREHNEPWPFGRTNHYLFDLNRDWLPLVHPESRGRMALWHAWHPQLSTDFHEMGGDATYFFQPGIPSRNNPRTPQLNYDLTAQVAQYHARALDRIGSLYYTRESFDDYYLGKGSSYPDVQGTVGILFEQASSRALAAETVHGVLDYGTTVRNQLATSLSSLEAAVAMREDLLRFQRDTYLSAPRVAREAPVKAYVFDTATYPDRAADLVDLLGGHRIRAHHLARRVEVGGEVFEPGRALIVPVDQPQARLIQATFERVHEFPDTLFYDVSTWTLPLAYGMRHAEVTGDPAGLVGDVVKELRPAGGLIGGRASYAYLIPWGSAEAPRVLYELQAAGVRARLVRDPMETSVAGQQQRFGRGTIVVPLAQAGVDAEDIHRVMADAAGRGLEAFAVGTGLVQAGPDLGGASTRVLERPSVALLAGRGTTPGAVGEVWHLLTRRVGMPITLLDLDEVDTADLRRYTTLVMAHQPNPRSDEALADRLRAWVREGGVLVATQGGAGWAARHGLADLTERPPVADTTDYAYADVQSARGAHLIGGAIFDVTLDVTHPIGFGHPGRVAAFKQGTQAFDASAAAGTNVGRYALQPRLSGYVSEPNVERIREGAALVAQRSGRGAVVLFDFNPAFRGFWRGTEGLLVNAVFFGGSF
jgi:SAM-dependent methyltransferase